MKSVLQNKQIIENCDKAIAKWIMDVLVPFNAVNDAILPRKGPVTKAMSKRLQEDWAKDAREDPRVLMSLRVDFGPMG